MCPLFWKDFAWRCWNYLVVWFSAPIGYRRRDTDMHSSHGRWVRPSNSQQLLISDDVITHLPSGLTVTHENRSAGKQGENRASFSVTPPVLGLLLPSWSEVRRLFLIREPETGSYIMATCYTWNTHLPGDAGSKIRLERRNLKVKTGK